MQIILYIGIMFVLSCTKVEGVADEKASVEEKNTHSLEGTWYYSRELFNQEQAVITEPKADLSYNFKIKMTFNNEGDFTSFLDNQITKGKWKIEDDLLHMFLKDRGWLSYSYKHSGNQLVIYDREYIIALERRE